jgi:hypothetical protein
VAEEISPVLKKKLSEIHNKYVKFISDMDRDASDVYAAIKQEKDPYVAAAAKLVARTIMSIKSKGPNEIQSMARRVYDPNYSKKF